MALPHGDLSFTPKTTLSAADLNKLVANDRALANGTAYEDNAIPASKLEKVSNGFIYSSDEQKTPYVWLDGKPIYRRVYEAQTEDRSEKQHFNIPIGFELRTVKLVKIDATLLTRGDNGFRPLPWCYQSDGNSHSFYGSGSNFTWYCPYSPQQWKIRIIFEYAK